MAENENEVTPEEKLLKVIQDGGEAEQEKVGEGATIVPPSSAPEVTAEDIAAASPTKAAAEGAGAEVPAVEEEPAAKPKLKVAKQEPEEKAEGQEEAEAGAKAEEKEPKGKGAGKKAASKPGLIEAGPVVTATVGKPSGFGISTVNKCLAAVVLIMIGFAVYEIWASIQIPQKDAPEITDVPAPGWMDSAADQSTIPIEDVLKAFKEKSIIGMKELAQPVAPGPKKPPPATSLELYAKENLNLIGLSDDEAIVVDKKIDKMYFLKVGDKIKIDDRDLSLVEITSEQVTVTVGDREIRIE